MRHHYIPQFYLRPWLTDHKLQEFRRGYGGLVRTGRYGTVSTGYVDNLYTVPGATDDTKQNMETTFLARVDGDARPVRELLLHRNSLSLDQRHAWAKFILSLLIRTPEDLTEFKILHKARYDVPNPSIQAKYDRTRTPELPDRYQDYFDALDPTMLERQAVILTADMIQNQNILRTIRGMGWRVIDTSRVSRRLMTSDRPVIMPTGLHAMDGHIALPISPTKLFLASSFESHGEKVEKMPVGKLVRTVNEIVIRQARKYVYGLDSSGMTEVRKWMSTSDYPSLLPTRKSFDRWIGTASNGP